MRAKVEKTNSTIKNDGLDQQAENTIRATYSKPETVLTSSSLIPIYFHFTQKIEPRVVLGKIGVV